MFHPPGAIRAGSPAAKERDLGNDVRAQVWRRVDEAWFLMRGGYLELAAGRRRRL